MIRLRVTDLDAWVRFIEPEREEFEVSLDAFLAQMRRQSEPSDDMLAGSAFHAVLEHMNDGDDLEEVERDGFTFRFGADLPLVLPDSREESVEKVYQTSVGPVMLRGRIDARGRMSATDYKLTTSTFDAERYAGSLQWKAYLDMTGDRRFQYLVFQSKRTERDVWIYDMHSLVQWSYPEMGEEVRRRVDELAQFVVQHVPELVTPDMEVAA